MLQGIHQLNYEEASTRQAFLPPSHGQPFLVHVPPPVQQPAMQAAHVAGALAERVSMGDLLQEDSPTWQVLVWLHVHGQQILISMRPPCAKPDLRQL